MHAKDGRWPTNPDKLGEEVLIGTGLVDFHEVFEGAAQSRLRRRHHHRTRDLTGLSRSKMYVTEKLYLEKVLARVG